MSQSSNKFVITFAGVVGSSKTPTVNYLSYKLNLPVFNNDAIRSEVIEDLGSFDQEEYLRRRDERGKELVESGVSFIYDASVDREWATRKPLLQRYGYDCFLISFDLSQTFVEKLYKAKGYHESLQRLDALMNDHAVFLENFSDDVHVHIADKDFQQRLAIAYEAAIGWLSERSSSV